MFTNLQTRLKKAGRLLPVALLPFAAQAQSLNYSAANASVVAGTFTNVGTTGTAISTANTDDANSVAVPIGFTFNFNGTAFTDFVLNTNGFLKLGTTAPSAAAMFLPEGTATNIDPFQSPDPADVNIIAPLNIDLTAGNGTGGASYRVATTGTAPNRVATIQWTNVSDKAATSPTQYANLSFQVKLYETTNNVEFVYDAAVASTAASTLRFTQAGIKGSGFANGQFVQALKQSAAAWNTATFANAITGNPPTLNTLNIRNTVPPTAGVTYRFAPGAAVAPANDNCTGATALTVSATCTPATVTNAGSTGSTGPTPTCDINPVISDVWYTAVVPTSGSLTVTTSAVAGSLLDDTVLEIYTGTCTGLTSVACNDDGGGAGFFSSATARSLTPGSTVYIRVWSYDDSDTGQFGICATPAAVGPANDDPNGAIALTLAATCTPTSGTNVGATTTTAVGYTNPGCGIAVSPKDVWYRFTTAASGQQGATAVTITVTGAPAGQVRVFSSTTGAAGPFTSVGCSAAAANNAVAPPLELRGLTPATTYYVFVSGYGSTDTQGAFTICASILTLPATDAAVSAIYTLGTVSATYSSPVRVQTVVTNAGASTLTNVPVTLLVSGSSLFSNTQTVPTLAPGASTTLTFNYPVTATSGTNTLTVTAAATGDAVATNNTRTATQTLTALSLSQFSTTTPTFTGGIGSNTAANVELLVRYNTVSAARITTVTPTFAGTGSATSTYQVVIYSANAAGTPGTLLYTSPTRTRPATALNDPVSVPNISVTGDFFVGVRQLTTTNIGLGFFTDTALPPATFYIGGGTPITFSDLNTSTLSPRLGIDVTFGTATSTRNEALAATVSLYPNPAHQRFTLALPAGSLNSASASLTNALGQVVLMRKLNLPAAGGTTDFDVSRLAAGVYSLQLKSGNDLVVKRVVVE